MAGTKCRTAREQKKLHSEVSLFVMFPNTYAVDFHVREQGDPCRLILSDFVEIITGPRPLPDHPSRMPWAVGQGAWVVRLLWDKVPPSRRARTSQMFAIARERKQISFSSLFVKSKQTNSHLLKCVQNEQHKT